LVDQSLVLKTLIRSYYDDATRLLVHYQSVKNIWIEKQKQNELLFDFGSSLFQGYRTAKKYIRRVTIGNKWEETEEFAQIKNEFEILVNRVKSTLENCFSLSRKGIYGDSGEIQRALVRAITKTRLETKLKHLKKFLAKLSEEKLTDNQTWLDVKSSKQKVVNHPNPLKQYLAAILNGNHPTLSNDLARMLAIPGETLWIEKKQQISLKNDQDWLELMRDMMSAANALTRYPIGIFVGVVDKTGEFISVTLVDEAEIRQRILSKVTPPITFTIIPVQYPNECIGQVIAIQPTDKIHSFRCNWRDKKRTFTKKGEVWLREGSRKRRLDENEALEYARKKTRFWSVEKLI